MDYVTVHDRAVPDTVPKHSAFIAISNDITVMQRKAWNCMLSHAYQHLPKHDVHMISMRQLLDAMSMTTNNHEHIKQKIGELMKIQVRVNLLGKSRQKWEGMYQLLANVEYSGGMVFYSYGGLLRERLYDPEVYAMLPVDTSSYFGSKYAEALYELCEDYWKVGRTPVMELDMVKDLLVGNEKGDWAEFRYFSRDVIKKSVNEINKRTEFVVTAKYIKGARGRIRAIQFMISKKEGQVPLFKDPKRTPAPTRIVAKIPESMRSGGEAYEPSDVEIWFDSLDPSFRKDLWQSLTDKASQDNPDTSGFALESQVWIALNKYRIAHHEDQRNLDL